MKKKKAYLTLKTVKVSVGGMEYVCPKGMIGLLAIFTSKKQALKYSNEIQEVEWKLNK